ncbi:hypothetical protein H6758_04420 [Candidatus Nomurabacteria bacterium]|nr:hypothetical protein [Candidatus Nomurabacteria bacterium]
MDNFIQGIIAISADLKEFFVYLAFNRVFLSFASGAIISILIVGLILTKNPKDIPVILRYDSTQGFQRISARTESGTFEHSYSRFVKLHAQIRILALIAMITFFVAITAIVINA